MAKTLLTGIGSPTQVMSAPKTPPAMIKTPMGPRVKPAPRVMVAARRNIQPVLGGRQRNRSY